MATSPNYGWSEPDNTSLVKDGAQAMRTLGDAIDSSVWNVGFGQAGKNKIINGDFGIWQRGTSFSGFATGMYTADRWSGLFINNTVTVSRQAFTTGSAPVAGYESQYFFRYNRTVVNSGTPDYFGQNIENVRTFAGQTVTLSFWAKGSTAFSIQAYYDQNFGSGGSSTVGSSAGTFNVTTSWQRFTFTTTLASISGKTIGTNDKLQLVYLVGTAAGTVSLDLWGVQVEAGSKATPFQTASGGSIQSELAMCQRYYFRTGATDTYGVMGVASCISTTSGRAMINLPVPMRTIPTSVDSSSLAIGIPGSSAVAISSVALSSATVNSPSISFSFSTAFSANQIVMLTANNSTSAYVGFSAEL